MYLVCMWSELAYRDFVQFSVVLLVSPVEVEGRERRRGRMERGRGLRRVGESRWRRKEDKKKKVSGKMQEGRTREGKSQTNRHQGRVREAG